MKLTRLLPLIAGTAFLGVAAQAQNFVTNGLVAYYPFNGNSNDESGNGNNASDITATLCADRFGNADSAYSFDGVGACIGFANPPLTQVDNWTVVAWINPATLDSPTEIAVGLGFDDGVNGDGYSLGISGGRLHAIFGGIEDLDGGFNFPATNHWYQIAMSRNSGTTGFFVNGEFITGGDTTTPAMPTAFRIGSNIGLRFFNGAIDDVRIYDRALSVQEVAQLFAMETVSPRITSGPTNLTVNLGDTAIFYVVAEGVAPLRYQWMKAGGPILNATNATLVLTNARPALIGDYSVVVTDTNGSVTSSLASLSISNLAPVFWQGLAAYYPFSGDATDASGNGNDATTIQATLCPDRFGNPNQAYQFSGNGDYIGFASPPLTQTDNWSLVAWVNPKSLNQSGIAVGLGFDNGVTGNGYSLGINAGQLYSIFGGVSGIPGGFTFPSIGEWYQIGMVRDSGMTRYFVNGTATANTSLTAPSTPTAFRIGSNTGVRFFNGAIDEVRIYNRALSSNDLAQLYAAEAPPHAATGYATLSGDTVAAVNLVDNGGGYTNTPMVRFIGGGGSGAQAAAVVSNGVVIAVNLAGAGAGYTSPPVVVVDPPFIPSPILGIAQITFLAFNSLSVSSNYQLQKFQPPSWINQSAGFTATNTGYTQIVAGAWSSADYRLVLAPLPAQASAIAQVVNGFVVGALVTAGGSGYITPPAVTIVANKGSNATAVASISGGHVSGITVINAGSGYVKPVTIQIDPPTMTTIAPDALPGMQLVSSRLSPYENYQIQFATNLPAGWQNWPDGLFSPTNLMNSQNLYPSGDRAFLRLQHVP